MGVFDQMGDPVCPPCLCQHHEDAYATLNPDVFDGNIYMTWMQIANGGTVISQSITTTKTCCIIVMTANLVDYPIWPSNFEIERPLATIKTTEEHYAMSGNLVLHHHAAWEVLDPGTYTYYLVNRSGGILNIYSTWMKLAASDCEG
jgi:hypothetical protein